MKKIIIFILCLLCFSQCLSAASDRYLIEDNLTGIAQQTLDAMFGKNNFIVRVQVQMTDSKYNVRYTKESNPQQSKSKSNKEGEQVYILPGGSSFKKYCT